MKTNQQLKNALIVYLQYLLKPQDAQTALLRYKTYILDSAYSRYLLEIQGI